MKKTAPVYSILVGLALIAGTSWAVYSLVALYLTASDTLKLGVLTAAISVIALIYNNARQHRREISSRHFSEKRQAYQKFFDFMFEMFSEDRTGVMLSEVEKEERARAIVKNLMIWGSADTINQYTNFVRSSVELDTDLDVDPKLFCNVESLLRSFRRDLGHDDSRLEALGLTKLLVKPEEHSKLTN